MEVRVDNTEHDSSLVKTFATYFEKENYLDVTFVCKGGRRVKAHKLVLSSVSPFLKKLFAEWNENQDMITILVPDIDHNILKLVFDFIYEGTMKLSKIELNTFKTILRMLEMNFPGALINVCQIQQVPRNGPPPLVKLDNKINSGLQKKPVTHKSNVGERKAAETAANTKDNCVLEINARQTSNPVDPLAADRRTRDPDDDPLNVPDVYFVPTTSRSAVQIRADDIIGGTVSSEDKECSERHTASGSSLTGQQESRPANNFHGAYSRNLSQQNRSSVEKRPYAQIASDTGQSTVASAVNEEQTQGKRIAYRNKGTVSGSHINQSTNSVVNTGDTQSWWTKTRKT